ncbi:Copia protein [Ceratobasidium theobromae]|uniref:Copia protein n=1 Tax=Ceratobasidium theobromae TaxID=1582974 RepID=A0A5N5Q8Y9_9AGAM|nr:Copia protein [Ceratobasidium theobromae]
MHAEDAPRLHVIADNMGLLQALLAHKPAGTLSVLDDVSKALWDLFTACPNSTLCISWCPAHARIPGNKRADAIAKCMVLSHPQPSFHVSMDYICLQAKFWLLADWHMHWLKFKASHLGSMGTEALLNLPCLKLHPFHHDPGKHHKVHMQLIHTITGHSRHASYLHRCGKIDSPACPCRATKQDVQHILLECPRHGRACDFLHGFSQRLSLPHIFSTVQGLKAALEFFTAGGVDIYSAPKSFKHVALNKHGKPHRVLWFWALSDIISTGFTPIESAHYASLDVQTLPPNILLCFHASMTACIDGTPCFDTWIAHNFSFITLPSVDDTDSPKWKNVIMSQRKDEWIASLNSEMGRLKNQDVYKDFPCHLIPLSNQLLTSGVVCRIKHNADRGELLLKSCVVVHGNCQITRLSYSNTFSNTLDLGLIRVILAITAYADFDCHMVDVTGAYTHAPIDRELYVEYPEGYGKGGPTVMKLKKALYSTHQSGRLWEEYQYTKILAIGYCPNQKDVSISTRMRNGVFSIIVCYVDNFVVCCTAGHIEPIKQEIMALFDCKDLGELRLFLGLVIKRDRVNQTLTMTMQSYIKSIVKSAGLDNAVWATTPISNMHLVLEPITPPDHSYPYVTNLGRLFWVARTCRPNIAFATSLLARFSNCYGSPHITALKCVFKYLAATASIGITYDGHRPFYEVAYSDADYASQHGCKSTSVSLSTMEAEFVALCNTAKEVMSIRQFLDDLGIAYKSSVPSPILCDNQAAIESVHNPMHKTRAKHINIAFNFIHDEIHEGTIFVPYVPTNDNLRQEIRQILQRGDLSLEISRNLWM